VIAKYVAGEPDRQARKANEELRLKRFREERAQLFEDLRNAGQYAPWNISMKELRLLHADLQRVNNGPATDLQRVAGVAVLGPATHLQRLPNTHSPLPISQVPVLKDIQSGESANADSTKESDCLPSVGTNPPPTTGKPFHDAVIAAYHELLPGLPTVKRWTDKRRGMLEARIRESCKLGKSADSIEYWRTFFGQVADSDFLCGRQTKWRADLEWLIKSENFVKVIENKYENRRPTNGGAHAYG
jgi:hypothetical protein